MSEPAQESVQRQASVVIAVVLLIVCLILMLGFAGTVYLWLNEKAQVVIDAEEHAAQIDEMRAAIPMVKQELEQKRGQLAQEESDLLLDLKRRAEERKANRVKQQAAVNRQAFTIKTPKLEPLGYPQPIKTEYWTGELHTDGGKPARYTLSSGGLAAIKPYQIHLPPKACAPFTFNHDGSKFFVIDSQSVLRRFDSTTLKEELTLMLGADVYDMELTAGGLALSFTGRNKIWMIDPQTFSVSGEIEIERPTHLAATAASQRVYAVGQKRAIAFDLATYKIGWSGMHNRSGQNPVLARRLTSKINSLVMHPDGERLITGSTSNFGVHQFATASSSVEYLASGQATPIRAYPSMAVHPEGRWLAVPQKVTRKESLQTLALLDANNLKNLGPLIRADGHITACDFDVVRDEIVVAVGTNQLCTYTMAGERAKQYEFEDHGKVIRLAAFPIGGRYFMWSNKGMWVIDLDPDRIMAAIPEAHYWRQEAQTP